MRYTEAWAVELVHDALQHSTRPRSREYKAGMLAGAREALGLDRPTNPHRAGTSAADAWSFGTQEGRALAAAWEYQRTRQAVS